MSRILIADDSPIQLDIRRQLLEAGGHQVSIAFCPAEALRQLPSADLVIMDLRFPNASGDNDPAEGLALIRAIRASGCGTPLIVLSGWPQDLDEHPEAELVSRILIKPIGMQALLEAIGELTVSTRER